jgi:hypothetical protein
MSSQTVRCQSKTSKGTKCRRIVSNDEIFCFQHHQERKKPIVEKEPTVHCQSKTSKGTKCRRFVSNGEIFCFQHHQEHKEPIIEHKEPIKPTNIVHVKPACVFSPVEFKLNGVSDSCCRYKNKYGEFACNDERKHSHFCNEHHNICHKFKRIIAHLTRVCREMLITPHAVDSFLKVFYNMFNYFHINREYLVNFSSDSTIERIQIEINRKIFNFKQSLINGSFSNNLRIYKNSLGLKYHIDKLGYLEKKSNDIIIGVQIKNARESLISNNIKIHKLSEIHLRIKPDSNQLFAVISQGLDKKILSFI